LQWAGVGPAGSGKTHFLMTAPEPIAVHLFSDPGGVSKLKRKPEFKDRDIRWIEYNFNPGILALADRPKAAQDELATFIDNYATSLRNFRTIGWDKEDMVWELLRYAKLEYYTDKPNSYYELNNQYRGWFHDAAMAGVNLAILRGMKEKWGLNAKGTPSGLGVNEPRGQKWVTEVVEVNLQHRWDNDEREFKVMVAPPSTKDDEGPKLRVGNVADLIGQEFGSFDFLQLAMAIYPESSPSDWGLE
jgi:hypothetical protein